MKVVKFGGSSVIDAEHMERVADLIIDTAGDTPLVAVFSAMGGVTDLLIEAARAAEAGDSGHTRFLSRISERSTDAAARLLGRDAPPPWIKHLLDELSDIAHGIELVHECTARSMDLLMSFGERISCRLMSEYLAYRNVESRYIDARELIVTDNTHGAAVVDTEASYPRIKHAVDTALGSGALVPVVTGFLAATPDGVTTTLGRNGSDFTASLLGAALGAEAIEIWTDVDGVLSADPRAVPSAFVVPELSYQEAMELSYFGAKVIHPRTMLPAVELGIPIIIKNTLNPAAPGTRIAGIEPAQERLATGITSVEGIALLDVTGGGMIGTPGIASRVFSALARTGVNVMMISQASSEHSISLVFREEDAASAVAALEAELAFEMQTHQIDPFDVKGDLEIVAVIGGNMRGKAGVAGRLFTALGDEGINIHAIAQGASEMNISCVIDTTVRSRAVTALHRAFFGE